MIKIKKKNKMAKKCLNVSILKDLKDNNFTRRLRKFKKF